MVFKSIQALGSTLLRTQLETDTFSLLNTFANKALIPLQCVIGQTTYKIKANKIEQQFQATSLLSTAFKVIGCFVVSMPILRSQFAFVAKKLAGCYTILVALGAAARAVSLFQNKITTVYGVTNAFKAILESNRGPTIRTKEQQKKDINLADAIKDKIAKDTEFFTTFNSKHKENLEEAKKWLKAQKELPTYTYPFFTAKALQERTDDLPKEANDAIADLTEYWAAYWPCSTCLERLTEFEPYLNESDHIQGRTLEDFFKSWQQI